MGKQGKTIAIVGFVLYMIVFCHLMFLCMNRTIKHVHVYEYVDEAELEAKEKLVEL